MNVRNFAVSALVILVTVATFVGLPTSARSISIDRLQLTSEAAGINLAEGTCPIKGQHTSCQQSVNTGAFGTVPAPVVAEGTCPIKGQHTSCQQSVNTGAFGTIPAPMVVAEGTCPVKSQHTCCQQSVNTGAFGTCPAPRIASL